MEKLNSTELKLNKNISKNNANIGDEFINEDENKMQEFETVDQDLTPEAQEERTKKDLPLLKELIALVYFGPLLPQELAELYAQYTGQNLRKKTKVPVKEFLKGHKSIFKFFVKHQVVDEEESKKKQTLELVSLQLDHPIVKEVIAESTPTKLNTQLDYVYTSTKVCNALLAIVDLSNDTPPKSR